MSDFNPGNQQSKDAKRIAELEAALREVGELPEKWALAVHGIGSKKDCIDGMEYARRKCADELRAILDKYVPE